MTPNAPKRAHKVQISLRPHEFEAAQATAHQFNITITEVVRGWVIGGLRTGTIPDGAFPPPQAEAVDAAAPATAVPA
jgi:hypothetical protein